MDVRDWENFLIPYAQVVEELKVKFKALRSELKKREEFSTIEFVTGRIKRTSSILAKAKRLGVPMDKIEQGIEDIAGLRIMCQFVEDIQVVADIVRARKDMVVIYEKDYVTDQKESGYRSYHMIVEYPVQSALGMKKVLAEIQIRTLAMNFWATIEHSLNYKFQESLPDEIKRRLKKAAEAAFRLDEEMSSIREQIVDAQIEFEDKSNVVARILNMIQQLYFYQHAQEASSYQKSFNALWDRDDLAGLKQLAKNIEVTIAHFKKD